MYVVCITFVNKFDEGACLYFFFDITKNVRKIIFIKPGFLKRDCIAIYENFRCNGEFIKNHGLQGNGLLYTSFIYSYRYQHLG